MSASRSGAVSHRPCRARRVRLEAPESARCAGASSRSVQLNVPPGIAFPPVGPVSLGSHLRRYDAIRRLPPYPSRVAALVARFPIPCLLPRVRGSLTGSCSGGSPRPRLVLWSPGPQSGLMVAERDGSPTFPSSLFACMPRSQTPVVPSASALTRPGLLPLGACTPSAFPAVPLERYPTVHDSIHFGAPSRGLHPHSLQLRPPIAGLARGGRS